MPPITSTRGRTQPMMRSTSTRSKTQLMRGSTKKIKRTAGSSAGTGIIPIVTVAVQAAGITPTTMEFIGMATTARPVTMRMTMFTRAVSSSTHTIHKKAHTRGTRRMSRTIRRPRRRNIMMSLFARAGTRSSLLPITECLSGTTAPTREILSSNHSGWEISRPPPTGPTLQATPHLLPRLEWRRRP